MRTRIAIASARITKASLVNQPKCPVHHCHRDGQMNVYGGIKTGNPDAYYEPNSFNGPVEQPSAKSSRRCASPAMRIAANHRIGNDDYSAAARAVPICSMQRRAAPVSNIAAAMRGVPGFIVERQLGPFQVDPPGI